MHSLLIAHEKKKSQRTAMNETHSFAYYISVHFSSPVSLLPPFSLTLCVCPSLSYLLYHLYSITYIYIYMYVYM